MTIKQIQCLLAYLGYYTAQVDGVAGAKTAKAVRDFQQAFGGLQVDGIAGNATQKALRHAVAYGMPDKEAGSGAGGSDTSTTNPGDSGDDSSNGSGTFWDKIKYFQRSEFKCKCGGKYCDGFTAEPEELLVRAAEKVRNHFGAPVTISSGVRCKTHNANVRGVYNSRHLSGKAMDFCVRGFSASSVLAYVQSLPEIRYAYAIDNWYVHMDVL